MWSVTCITLTSEKVFTSEEGKEHFGVHAVNFLRRMTLNARFAMHDFIYFFFKKRAALLNLVLSVQTNVSYFASSSVFSVTQKRESGLKVQLISNDELSVSPQGGH